MTCERFLPSEALHLTYDELLRPRRAQHARLRCSQGEDCSGVLTFCTSRYVDPASRGLGIGKKLLAQAKVLAEETNATGVLSMLFQAKKEVSM